MGIMIQSEDKDKELQKSVERIVGDHDPQFCYECTKCTSGCPISKISSKFQPHIIVVLTRMGIIEDLINNQEIWQCAQCLTCKERCPQSVAPADLIIALRNVAYKKGLAIPKSFIQLKKKIYSSGIIGEPTEIMSRDMDFYDREILELPDLELKNQKSFQKEMEAVKLIEKKRESNE